MPHSARAMKRQQCLTHRPINKRGWVSQTRTFSDCFAEFLQAWYPTKGFYIFTLYAIWPIYTRRTLPGPDPVLQQVANIAVSNIPVLSSTVTTVASARDDAAKLTVQSFVSTHLDYCNSLMYGIADGLMQRLQAVQNAAARLITSARRRDHISPVLRQLHWLPVRQRVQFKLTVLVFKALHGQAPQCLTDDCQLVAAAGRRQLSVI